jgi:hypothetical protein
MVFGKARGLVRRGRALWGAALWGVGCGGLAVEELPDPEVELAGSGGRGGRAAAGGNGGGDEAGAPSVAGAGGKVPDIPEGGGAGMGGAPVSDGGDGGDLGAGGEPWVGEEDPPYVGPTVVELRLGTQHSCARLADESVQCWGKDVIAHDEEYGFTDTGVIQWPAGPYATSGRQPPPGGDFTDVTYGGGHACGLRPNGTIECWGDSDFEETSAPEGSYRLVEVGADHTCAFGDHTGVTCWGRDDGFQSSPPALLSARNQGYVRVAAGGSGVSSWGTWSELEEEGGGSGQSPGPNVATACGLRADGSLHCFGARPGAPRKKFQDMSVSERATCGVTSKGVECWGEDVEGASVAGEFVQVSTSWQYTCVIDTEGQLSCWAPLPGGTPMTVPEGTFRRVAAAGTRDYGTGPHVSALRTDGSIVTVRLDEETGAMSGSFEVAGPFVDVAGGHDTTCAVTASGGLSCWDRYSPPGADPEAAGFERVVMGFNQGCGLRADGSVSCWGGLGQWDTDDFIFVVGDYPGPFTDLSMGGDYACGVLADGGGIKCWGSHVR